MLARIHAAPNVGSIRAVLQVIADTLFAINRRWIADALARGLSPPRSVGDCSPPWCSRRITYRPYHGKLPASDERDYLDGPMIFHRGVATCIDVASYDAAALVEIDRVDARPEVQGVELTQLHCVVALANGRTLDPTAGLEPGETITRSWQ